MRRRPPKKLRAVIFDLDGTLVDTADEFVVVHTERGGCVECETIGEELCEFAARTSAPGATMRLGRHGAQVLRRTA